MLLTDIINPAMFDHIEPSDLVTTGSLSCFKNFVYVGEDPKAWPFSDDYCEGLKVVIALTDTNDHAERGVALIEEYSSILTHSEEQTQYLVQVVSKHRKKFPNRKKSTPTL